MDLKEAELKTQDPSFWNDPKKAEEQMKTIRGLKYWVESFDKSKAAVDDLEVLYEFVKEGMTSEAELDKSYKIILKEIQDGPHDAPVRLRWQPGWPRRRRCTEAVGREPELEGRRKRRRCTAAAPRRSGRRC